jgi:hypothetical protein
MLWLGAVPVDRELMAETLRKGNACVMSGGIAELFLSCRTREELFLRERKGFVRLAKDANAILVPVYAFGHTRLFDQLATGGGVAMLLSRLIRGSITFFWGRLFLPVPYPAPLHVAYGPPMMVDWSASESTVDAVHAMFVQRVKDLYAEHRDTAGYGDAPLIIS